MLMDFGLALTTGPAEHSRLTETGVMVGTVYYMSPDQLNEETGLDQRSDRAPVPPLRQINPSVPPGVEQAIGRALAKSPAERVAPMEEFAAALMAA